MKNEIIQVSKFGIHKSLWTWQLYYMHLFTHHLHVLYYIHVFVFVMQYIYILESSIWILYARIFRLIQFDPALISFFQVRISPTVPNFITVNWYFDPNNALQSQLYTVGIYLVKRLSPKDLIDKLSKDGVKPPEFAKVSSCIRESCFCIFCSLVFLRIFCLIQHFCFHKSILKSFNFLKFCYKVFDLVNCFFLI